MVTLTAAVPGYRVGMTMVRPLDDAAVAALAALVRAAPPRAGRTVVLGIDGRSGAGKTALAARLAAELDAAVVHLDDIYPGWDGLAAGVALLARRVLEPLARGEPALVPRWDWQAGAWAAPARLAPPPVLIVDGVGAASAVIRRHASVLAWLELDGAERRRRALARDGATYEPHWDRWAAQEDRLIAAEGLPAGVDLILDVAAGEVNIRGE